MNKKYMRAYILIAFVFLIYGVAVIHLLKMLFLELLLSFLYWQLQHRFILYILC